MPLVSLNDEPKLAHWRQQSAGSAFQFTTPSYANSFFHVNEDSINQLLKSKTVKGELSPLTND